MRTVVRGLAAVAVVVAVGWPGAASAVGQGWTAQPVPLPGTAITGRLTTVSCVSADDCLAGGYQEERSGVFQPLGERWDGSSWQVIQFAPLPAQVSFLKQVLCVSASSCFMVGFYNGPSNAAVPLVEHWDGSSWTVQAVPSPYGDAELYGISCPAADDCVAVGATVSPSGKDWVPLAERWDGSSWAQQPVPRPKNAGTEGRRTYLFSISCVSAANCTAVGQIGLVRDHSLAEHWNGIHWAIEPTPAPPGARFYALDGVSCPKAGFCLATGFSSTMRTPRGGITALAVIWTGHGWTQQALPPAGSTGELLGISCASAVRCTAVGTTALAEYWTGSSWAIQPTAPPRVLRNLAAISCTAPRVCTAVGATDDTVKPIAENENQ